MQYFQRIRYAMPLKKITVILCLVIILSSAGCSAFVIRQTDDKGASRTYVTDTIFVGTGTFVDCLISPVHWLMGFFYFQPYIHVQGGNFSYPTFGASGCFSSAYSKGNSILGIFHLKLGMFGGESANSQVYFVDANAKETVISGGNIEVHRVTDRINFSSN